MHCARLADHPVVVLELPNLHPSVDQLAKATHALVAPSHFALQHPSVVSFTRAATGMHAADAAAESAARVPAVVIPPAALSAPGAGSEEPTTHGSRGSSGRLAVGMVSRLDPERSPGLFLHAAAALVQTWNTTLEFHVFGDGVLRADLEALANQLNLTDMLTFHGNVRGSLACPPHQ